MISESLHNAPEEEGNPYGSWEDAAFLWDGKDFNSPRLRVYLMETLVGANRYTGLVVARKGESNQFVIPLQASLDRQDLFKHFLSKRWTKHPALVANAVSDKQDFLRIYMEELIVYINKDRGLGQMEALRDIVKLGLNPNPKFGSRFNKIKANMARGSIPDYGLKLTDSVLASKQKPSISLVFGYHPVFRNSKLWGSLPENVEENVESIINYAQTRPCSRVGLENPLGIKPVRFDYIEQNIDTILKKLTNRG